MSVQIARRHFTVEDFYRMLEAGILTEDDRVELIDGEIIEMSPIGSRHAASVMRLSILLTERLGRAALVNVQNPLRLSRKTEPLPDVVVLKPRADFYGESHPGPADVLLVVEVADTALSYDRRVKLPLYARAGVPEVWIVNLPKSVVEVYTRPGGETYTEIRKAGRGQALKATGLPSLEVKVDDILG